jgi:hypothetical protein
MKYTIKEKIIGRKVNFVFHAHQYSKIFFAKLVSNIHYDSQNIFTHYLEDSKSIYFFKNKH